MKGWVTSTTLATAALTTAADAAASGYSAQQIRDLDDLDDLDDPIVALRTRLTTIAERTLALLDAGAAITDLINITHDQGTSRLR